MGCVNPGKVEHDECAVRVPCSSLTAAEAVNRDLGAARSRQRTLRHDEFNPVEVGGRDESDSGAEVRAGRG